MNKKIALLSVGLVLSVAAVGTSLALVYGDGANNSTSGALDAGAVLTLADLDNDNFSSLSSTSYETVDVTINRPVASTSIATSDYVGLTFTLDYDDSYSGDVKIVVEIATTDWATQGTSAASTLTDDEATVTFYTKISDFTADTMTYYLRLSLDGNPEEGSEPSGTLTIAYDYVSAADYATANPGD